MRVLLVAPFAPGAIRGNVVAADRIARHARAAGADVLLRHAAELDVAAARAIAPSLVHGFQVWHSGPRAAELARELRVPLVLSFRGSDAEEHLEAPERRAAIAAAVAVASRLTALTRHHARRIAAELRPDAPIDVVPQGVEVGPSSRDWRAELRIDRDAPLVAQLSSLRRMKSFPDVLALVDALRAAAPRLRYALAGPWVEPDLQPSIERWLAARAWADYVGAIAPADAQALQQQADVSLHSGRREGTANALLEALALGTPALVLATEVTRELLRHEQEAWLFATPAGAVAGLRRILGEPEFARDLAAAGRRAVHERHDPAREAAGYIRAWNLALGR